MKLNNILFLIFLCTNFSDRIVAKQIVSNKVYHRYTNETVEFGKYLKNKFNKRIPNDTSYYFLISETGCHGCIMGVIDLFKGNSKTIFIVSPTTKNIYFGRNFSSPHLFVDSTEEINRIRFHKGNIAVVATSANRIDTIIAFEPSTLSNQTRCLRK